MYDTVKRVFDLISALIGLVLLAPLLIMITLAIYLDSPGPVFYRGRRVGRFGKIFRVYKFRTMHVGAEALSTTTAKDDPRITRVGRFLRRCKLDELPQLMNVIKGEMSIVGPRPEVEEHTSVYNDEEKLILSVLPGITDYASIQLVNLNKILGSENPHQLYVTKIRAKKNQLRLKYVRSRSFCEDLRIIMLTLITVIHTATQRREEE